MLLGVLSVQLTCLHFFDVYEFLLHRLKGRRM
jgi:hypothetical protein